MSQNYEESPVSDGKMDISDETTSQESTGVSPSGDVDSLPEHQDKAATGFDVLIAANLIESPRKMHTKLCNNDGPYIDSHDVDLSDRTKIDNLLLDNEQSSENVLRLGQYNSNLLRSELTLANSHPLMSPPGTDSDSENGQLHRYKTKNFNFPDVVPVSDLQQQIHQHQQHDHQPQTQTHTSEDLTFNSSRLIGNNKICVNSIQFEEITSTDIATKNSNNTMTFSVVKPRRKIEFLRISSPDNSSSESEPEISQYQAAVDESYQSVALIANSQNRESKIPSPKPLTRRKIPISAELLSDDMSSLDSISNHSFDDDMEPNLASLSPSSSLMDGLNEKDDDYIDIDTPTNALPSDPIPTYTAKQERRDSRNWQKVTLPDGLTREIDMKVIEPYKRVLSHGGYLKAGGHNAIVMFCACHLPDRSRADYHYVMDNLFLYVVKTLEQLVTDDYVLVYLHGGSNRRNVPPFPWLKKCYQLLDRRLRKSLKNLYLVHPTFWLKSIVWMSRPFISSKFWRKLIYVRTLEKLYSLVSVEKAAIPDKVKSYDSKYA